MAQQTSGHSEIAVLEDRRHRVADSRRGELFAPIREQWIAADHEPARSQLDQLCEDSIKVGFTAGIQDVELQTEGMGRCLQLLRAFRKIWIGWIDDQGYDTPTTRIAGCCAPP